jgi:CRP/FNR family transcriptional regulator, polysaccharide utilization system transcription regulator
VKFCRICDKKCVPFRHLTDEELNLVNDNRQEVSFRAGEIIVKQGTSLTHAFTLSTGLAKVYLEGYDNRDLILKLVKPSEMVVGPGMFMDKKHHFSVSAVVNSTICLIDMGIFKQIFFNNKLFAEEFMREFSSRYAQTFHKFVSTCQKQMNGRIAEALLYLSQEIFGATEFDILLSRQELADFTGLSKESLIRILKEFKDDKIINTRSNHIEILNIKALEKYSEVG